jgi:hypothetical protein
LSVQIQKEQVEMRVEPIKSSRTVRGALALMAALTFAAAPAVAQDSDDPVTAEDGWHFTVAPYIWASGMEGSISFEGTPELPVDIPFSTIWDNLDLGFALHFEGRKDRWGFGLDGMYFKVAADQSFNISIGPGEVVGTIGIELQETLLEGFGFYRLAVSDRSTNPGFVDGFAGVRYVNANQRLTTANIALPERELSWADAVVGVRGYTPLGDRFGLMALGNVAFGSSLTWTFKGDIHWRMSNRWRLIVGYKYMDVDYEKGEGVLAREIYKMKHSGPEMAVSYSW